MKILVATTLGLLFLSGCTEKTTEVSSTSTVAPSPDPTESTATTQTTVEQTTSEPPAAAATDSATTAVNENLDEGTWTGQIAVAQPVSMFNYVGAESGDFAPMRFHTDSVAGKKILAACSNGDNCTFTGAIEWLDEAPPQDASAIGRIVRVDSAKRAPTP
jgi:PBP1b-binding outer membrane lipoprotein LpoB